MIRNQTGFYVWLTVLLISGSGMSVSSAQAAAQAQPNAKSPAGRAAMTNTSSVTSHKPAVPKPPRNAAPSLSVGSQDAKPIGAKSGKPKRQKHVGKKARPHAIVQAKPDLSYHGILEQPQRYDPGPGRHRGGAPNPQAGEVLHDHFQELDKNRDGLIDPFERAFGRLDMDRDLTNRQP